jgi:uncharacterized protein YdaU (DUF1376 family)
MAPERSPAFQFYPKDFLSDEKQRELSLAEAGAYIRLICLCWNEGSIPDDCERISRQLGVPKSAMSKLWPAIRKCFKESDQSGRLIHGRLEKERAKQEGYRRRQSDAATRRWNREGDATAMPRHKPATPTAEASYSQANATAMPERHNGGNALHLQSSSASSSALSRERKPPATNRNLSFSGDVLEVPRFLDAEFCRRLNGQYFDLTGFYLRLDAQLKASGEVWDLSWIRRQFDESSPQAAPQMSKRTRALMASDATFLAGGES